ncbi:MAG: HD domain-containing phosphohydrolase, partial [Clostridia bacterium]|nr:HD domain-containing phosphohydrolase [Clostridia bacterium]
EVLKQAVRKDDIIARIGGDEFMILLPKIEKSVVDKIMGRILRDTKAFQTTTLPLSIALGAAIKDNGKTSSDELFKKAEDEMYRNKLHEVSSRRNEAIKIISDTLYEKNEREEAHSERVSQICVMLGTAVGLSRPELNELKTLGLMHDIGKIAVEDEYLNKPDALTQEEFENIKKHPEAGFRILSTSTDMADLAEYVLSHHERWDGKGYPRGLAGEDIPFMARIISIAEAYDAMTNKAPYRRPMPHNKAYLELRKNAGSQFDPVLVKTFLQDVWPDLI